MKQDARIWMLVSLILASLLAGVVLGSLVLPGARAAAVPRISTVSFVCAFMSLSPSVSVEPRRSRLAEIARQEQLAGGARPAGLRGRAAHRLAGIRQAEPSLRSYKER